MSDFTGIHPYVTHFVFYSGIIIHGDGYGLDRMEISILAISHHYSSQKSMMTGDEGKPTDPAEITFSYFRQGAKNSHE